MFIKFDHQQQFSSQVRVPHEEKSTNPKETRRDNRDICDHAEKRQSCRFDPTEKRKDRCDERIDHEKSSTKKMTLRQIWESLQDRFGSNPPRLTATGNGEPGGDIPKSSIVAGEGGGCLPPPPVMTRAMGEGGGDIPKSSIVAGEGGGCLPPPPVMTRAMGEGGGDIPKPSIVAGEGGVIGCDIRPPQQMSLKKALDVFRDGENGI